MTPKGEPQTTSLLEQFRAITDPGAQTTFWQNLDAKQKALILSQSNK